MPSTSSTPGVSPQAHDLVIGSFLHQGTKATQEDGVAVDPNFNAFMEKVAAANGLDCIDIDMSPRRTFVCLLDGHAGPTCKEYVQQRILTQICLEFIRAPGSWPDAMRKAIMEMERKWCRRVCEHDPADRSGTTITIAILESNQLHCAWTGDSPCWLLDRAGTATAMTTQHRPSLAREQERIEKSGGEIKAKVVEGTGFWRRGGQRKEGPLRVFPSGLNISRSIGDIKYKVPKLGGQEGVVIADPDTRSIDLPSDVEYIVISSDGLSDNLTKGLGESYKPICKGFRNAYDALKEGREDPEPGQEPMEFCADLAAESLVYFAIKRGKSQKYQDNTSMVAICLLDNMKIAPL
ncbi:Protein phosphatase 1L [Hondaea fermentalgiana]|uniref:Protein phosphatase 1L n=1 Tax=Hondaea fermentalgiana TaxID=2315210 RepID=A0A2R5GNY7_9STRA|nr:Protein phosphatase 1L [Hondaea fermentalgiana]|eukprot:GBG32600.1 Protein phosphatase 1L [Hondaea fermentalgiana]